MKLVELKCKNCGSVLKVQPGTTDIHCEHCKSNYKLDDEVQHIKYHDMEKAGYDYEKGKLKARREHEEEKKQAAAKAEKDAKMKKWIILAWIFLFPFMFTYWLWAKSTLDKRMKIILTIGVWLLFFIVGISGGSGNTNRTTRTSNTTEQSQSANDSSNDASVSDKTEKEHLRKCTVMEAADLHNINGQKADSSFKKAKKTCESWLQEWGKDDFYKAVDMDWENRSSEKIDGKPLTHYVNQLGW